MTYQDSEGPVEESSPDKAELLVHQGTINESNSDQSSRESIHHI